MATGRVLAVAALGLAGVALLVLGLVAGVLGGDCVVCDLGVLPPLLAGLVAVVAAVAWGQLLWGLVAVPVAAVALVAAGLLAPGGIRGGAVTAGVALAVAAALVAVVLRRAPGGE